MDYENLTQQQKENLLEGLQWTKKIDFSTCPSKDIRKEKMCFWCVDCWIKAIKNDLNK